MRFSRLFPFCGKKKEVIHNIGKNSENTKLQSEYVVFAFAAPPVGTEMLSASICLQLLYHLGPPVELMPLASPCDMYSKQHMEATMVGQHQGTQSYKKLHQFPPLFN